MITAASSGAELTLAGARSELQVVVGSAGCPKRAPMIVGTARGGFHYPTTQAAFDLQPLFEQINARPDGAWIGFVDRSPAAKRPVGFIQSNLSRFYTDHYLAGWAGSPKVWKDFYFAALFALVGQMDSALEPHEMLIYHPTLSTNQWSKYMQGTLLDALGHLADSHALKVKRIHLGCPHQMTPDTLRFSAAMLNREQRRERPPALRPLVVHEVAPNEAGFPDFPGLRLYRVTVPEMAH